MEFGRRLFVRCGGQGFIFTMYKYVIGRFLDPIVATGVGLAAFKLYEVKQPGPTLWELVQTSFETVNKAN